MDLIKLQLWKGLSVPMASGKATGREGWLGLLCLVVSCGVHAGLLVASLHSLTTTPADVRPLTVDLIERPQVTAPALPLPEPMPQPSGTAVRPQRPSPVAPPASTSESPDSAATDAAAESGGEGGSIPAGGGFSVILMPADGKVPDRQPLIKATPRYEANPMPSYPQLARQNRWEGTVRLRVRVLANGGVAAATLERSSGYAVLDRAALDGVLQWRFIPATRGGVPVPSEVTVPVAFRLKE